MSAEILNPVKTVVVRGETVTVSELTWPKAMQLLNLVAKHVGGLLDARGNIDLSAERLAELAANTEGLASFLILESTGKGQDWLNELTAPEALDVLDAAVELTLSPELIGRGKKVAGRVRDALGLRISPASSISSPAAVTA